MASPITWRNVGSTVRPGGASRQPVNNGIDSILGSLGDIIQNNQQLQAANFKVTKENNTQDYLDTVAQASLAQLQDPEFAGSLTQQATAPGIDRGVARGAIDQRIAGLQKQQVQNQVFADAEQEVQDRGKKDELYAAANEGNIPKMQEILANHQFGDEGKLTNELNGMADAVKQRQYRLADEQRAEANADRAVESHALNMKVGQSNLAWNEEQRDELRDRRAELQLADSAAQENTDEFLGKRKATNEFLGNLGRDLGLPIGDDGLPDQSKMDDDQKAAYTKEVQDSGIGAGLSDTDERNALIEKMKGSSPEAIDRALKQQLVSQTLNQLTPVDKAKVEARVQAANGGLDGEIKRRTEDYERAQGRNAFINPTKTPLEDVNNALKGLGAANFGNEEERRQISNDLIDMASNGVSIKIDGVERVVPVPKSVIDNAIATIGESSSLPWKDNAANLKKEIINIMSSDGVKQQISEAPTLRTNFVNELQDLQKQKLSNAVKVTRSAQAQRGVTINPDDVLTNVLRRRQ